MVLFKRKPVALQPPPQYIDKNAEIWVMPKSGEIFTDYESYLGRYDFLNQKKFTDSVNGKSGLTFFAASDMETHSSIDIEKLFPDALRDPILRKVQFSTISRIDELVTMVFEEFKAEFFPGEEVDITLQSGDMFDGVIREKAKFEALRNPDGSIHRPAFSRYFVKVNNDHGDEALVDDKHIKRGRKIFTKQNLRSFLRNSLVREAWNGAPWLVKEPIARQYRLPMDIPAHLLQGAGAGSPSAAQHSSRQQPNGIFNKVNGRKSKNLTLGDFASENQQPNGSNATNGTHSTNIVPKIEVVKPVPPPIRYPIEDLDLPPKRDGISRPPLKFITDEEPAEGDLRPDSVGKLLEVWNTLNVQCQFFHLDSFTFDDFLAAMKFSSDEIICQLFDEVHCAVLKQIVDQEGALQVTLPDMALAEESESESEESEPATPIIDVPARSTRSRLSQIMAADAKERASKSPSESRHRPHRAPELFVERGWVERLQAREFIDGGWQTIMVGLLYQLSLSPREKQECDGILAHLAPLEEEPTQDLVWQRYITMDVNKRITALQKITLLAVSTKALREYLEESSEEQTEIRKRKLEWQKQRKVAMAQLGELDNQRKILLPDNLPESPKQHQQQAADSMDVDVPHVDDTLNTVGTPTSDMDDDEDAIGGRSLRRANERKRKRDEDQQRREREREEKEKAKMAKTNSKQSKEFLKILDQIDKLRKKILQCESEIDECDADLREASNHRTKVLGRDRFWNRYYWFERNGMPFGGLPDSSTAEYGYANARIWVQGPDDMERLGYIETSDSEQQAYFQRFGMKIPERKILDEGDSHLRTAEQWGYYDDPESINLLTAWLEEKGVREKPLRKELLLWGEIIESKMKKLKELVDGEKSKETTEDEPVTRMSTRHKTYVDTEADGLRCLKWHNNAAINEFGHLHSEPPKVKEKKGKKAAAPVVKEEKGVARPTNGKVTKPEPRQTRSKK
ncbi:hypothetical protein AAFC00_005736 [Neodothiora populina]|uniref:Uncharacterized protein n=1 Tax=Neodothiora populina TaxID=2781224 RepID=A0ABR3P706_9PEZI